MHITTQHCKIIKSFSYPSRHCRLIFGKFSPLRRLSTNKIHHPTILTLLFFVSMLLCVVLYGMRLFELEVSEFHSLFNTLRRSSLRWQMSSLSCTFCCWYRTHFFVSFFSVLKLLEFLNCFISFDDDGTSSLRKFFSLLFFFSLHSSQ